MRTSKKMLSFFLALVMVITSCSVGFTAFAADGNKTDSNLEYWNDATTADEAFDALNTLIGSLLSIDAIKDLLENNNIVDKVTDKTTLQDVIAGASPLLINALMDSSGLEAYLTDTNKNDIEDIANSFNTGGFSAGDSTPYRTGNRQITNVFYQAFASKDLATGNGGQSFYTLYRFATDYKDKGGNVGTFASEVYDSLKNYKDATEDELKKALKSDELIRDLYYRTITANESDAEVRNRATIDQIGNFNNEFNPITASGVTLKEVPATKASFDSEFGEGKDYLIDFYNNIFTKIGMPKLKNAAELVFYHCTTYGCNIIYANIYLYLMDKAGKTVTAEAFGDSSVKLTPSNVYDVLYKDPDDASDEGLYSVDDFANDYIGSVKGQKLFFNSGDDSINKGIYKDYLLYAVYDKLFGGIDDSIKNYDTLLSELNSEAGLVKADSDEAKETSSLQAAMLSAMGDGASVYRTGNGVCIVDYFMHYVCNAKSYGFEGSKYAPKTDEQKVAVASAVFDSKVVGILDTVGGFIDIKGLLKELVGGEIDLVAMIDGIWQKLYDAPVATVFNLLPPIMLIVDGILPVLLRDDIDDFNAIDYMIGSIPSSGGSLETFVLNDGLGNLLEALANTDALKIGKYAQMSGNNTIGLGALHLDLNKVLPSILHWVTGDRQGAIAMVGTYPSQKVFKFNKDGIIITDKTTGDARKVASTKTVKFNSNIPVFTNIYIADQFIYALNDDKLLELVSGLLGDTVKNALGNNGIKEIIDELLIFVRDAVDDYLAEVGYVKGQGTNDKNYLSGYQVNDGLNDIKVALPKLIDNIGKNFMTKYAVKSDWAFNYNGKIATRSVEDKDGNSQTETYNVHFDKFVKLSETIDNKDNPVKILTSVVDLLIGNWINALLDFLNDVLSDDSNKITSEVPLVQGLLAALGDFGEQSIITDALNGLFQLKRSDDASFTLTARTAATTIEGESKTNFVGFSLTSGFFLISNVLFTKKGQQRGLIPFIKAIIANDPNVQADYKVKKALRTTAPLLSGSKKANVSAAGTDYSKLLTKENKAAAQKLVDTLDTILASLLENTSLNGFDLDATDNFLSGFAELFAAYYGAKNTADLDKIFNNWLFFFTGESHKTPSKNGKIGTQPDKNGDVDAKKVYTSANLSNLVIQTYSLVENIVDYFFYNKESGVLSSRDPNMLIADALYGLISPDAVAIRMSKDYSKTAEILQKKDYHNWNSFKVQITALDYDRKQYNKKDFLKFGFSDGDKTAFYDALGESLNGIAGLLGAVFATSYTDKDRSGNLYSELLYPLLKNLADGVGADGVMSPKDFNKASGAQQLIKGIVTPLGNILSKLYDKPASFILNLVKGLAGVVKDDTIKQIIGGLQGTLNLHIDGISNIVSYLSPSYGKSLKKNLSKINVALPKKNILVTILNKFLADKLGFALPNINWTKLNEASTSGEVLLLIYGYVVDTLLGSELLTSLIDSLDPNISKILKNLSAAQILDVLADIISVVQSPTEVYWSFSEYAAKLTNSFSYPKGITASKADNAVKQFDQLINNIFPLLNGLGVTDIEGLGSLVNEKLYTNEIITTIAKALYGAIGGNDTVVQVLKVLGIDVTPKGMAAYLMDTSYGPTYSSAAKTLKGLSSWDKVTTLNWGFTNGTAKAQEGFINGLAAALRPLNSALSILLAEGKLGIIENLDVQEVVTLIINALVKSHETEIRSDKGEHAATITYRLKGDEFIVTVQSYGIRGNGKRTVKSVIKIDVKAISKDIEGVLKKIDLTLGTNGYESAIIPLLEAFMCDDIKTYKEYKEDYAKAKDNLLVDILKPIGGLIDTALANPIGTITAILPNVAYFIDSNGLSQAVANLIAPITAEEGLIGVLKKNGLDIDKLVEAITGKDLGSVLTDLIGIDADLHLELTNLKTFNIQVIVVPLVQKLLKDKFGLKLPDFTFAQIASHGEIKTVQSKAKNDEGTYLTEQVQARQGEVLVAVLKYVAETLIQNADALKDLLGGIDAIKNNDTIKSILDAVFASLSIATADDIVRAIFFIIDGDSVDKFFDYRGFKTKENNFSYGDLDEDFCRKLAPMLDGLIGGLLEGGLLGLVEEKLYTDELIGKLATGLYGAIEGVKINDEIGTLTDVLAMTDIDFSTSGVASLLTNSDYGKSYDAAAATIRSAGSWKNIKAENLKFGVKDRDSFLHALTAVLRPLFGVLDVLLNNASLNLFNLVSIPGSDGYTSAIVPLLEALGVYNIKTQYQYREDCFKSYDNVLLDILNPLWDKVEDILAAPLEVVMNLLPNLALVFANDGLLQIIDNLITPITALLDALKPIVDINAVLDAAGLDVPKLLKDKVGLNVTKFDLYDIQGTLKPLLGADNVVSTLNSVLKIIKIKDVSLNIELPEIDWLQLASHGKNNLKATSQVACYGSRIAVKGDEDETLIAVLRYLINTINYKNNYDELVSLLGGLFKGNDTVAGILDQVFGMLQGDSDEVIKNLVDLLQTLAG